MVCMKGISGVERGRKVERNGGEFILKMMWLGLGQKSRTNEVRRAS